MKYYLLTLSVLLSFPLMAQSTLEDCRSMARQHYPSVRRYELIQKTRDLSLSSASKSYLPQIVLGAQASWQNAVATFPEELTGIVKAAGMDIPGIRKDQYQVSVNIEQPLWDGGASASNKKITEAQSLVDSGSLNVELDELEKRVDDIYFGALMLESRISQAQSLIAFLQDKLDMVNAMKRSGVALQSDSDALEAERLGAEDALGALQTAKQSYLQMLSLFTGAQIDSLCVPEMPAFERNTTHPQLSFLDNRMALLEQQESAVRVSLMPRLSLYAQGWYGYPGLDMFRSMVSPDWSFNVIAGLRLKWNFSALFTREDSLQKIALQRQELEIQRDQLEFNQSLLNENELQDIRRLEESLERDRRISELRTSVRRAAESQYRNGVINLNDLLKTAKDENDALQTQALHRLELIKTAYEYKHNTL